jgi:hypothetical protein
MPFHSNARRRVNSERRSAFFSESVFNSSIFSRVAASWLAIVMVVAMATAHRGGPFTGYFLPLVILGSCLAHVEEIVVDTSMPIFELRNTLEIELKKRFTEFEAHLSLASGTGKEHMALIAAILSVPMGLRLVAFTKKGVEVLN